MTPGCTNPKAVNYNPSADQEDYSCIYLEKSAGVCHAFQDVANSVVDKSFTVSFSLIGKDFVFFHDYVPDFYFAGRDKLFNLKNRKVYINHKGSPGVYHDSTPRSFFIDAVFRSEEEFILNSIQWITEILNQDQDQEFTTLSHITVWNSQQCTGRISLASVFDSLEYKVRKTQSVWSFNTFRDLLSAYGSSFLGDLFNNFAVDPSALDANKPWYDQDLLHDNWCMIRFEFDNTSGNQFIFHSADINADKSYR